jgi:hypothetical protein
MQFNKSLINIHQLSNPEINMFSENLYFLTYKIQL